jgi:hypothetical protein
MGLKRILPVVSMVVVVLPFLFAGTACLPEAEVTDLVQGANMEVLTLQAAIEACLTEANAIQFDDAAGYTWSGDLVGSPEATDNYGTSFTVYSFFRNHELRAAYTIMQDGQITSADPTIPGGWGSKISWNAGTRKWEKAE